MIVGTKSMAEDELDAIIAEMEGTIANPDTREITLPSATQLCCRCGLRSPLQRVIVGGPEERGRGDFDAGW